ncbi:MAG TPA: hypothetical protein VEL78_07915, partial [Pyrinomonadaceae bacterium]|nr:hypothetical protein [Pyrinomonadaceae bacterium]
MNQSGIHLQWQVVQNLCARDLDLFDRRQTRLHLFSQVVIAKSTAGIFCRQLPTTTKQKENAGRDTCAPHAGCVRSSERKSMSRELIVSVNGREKKIAIVENDRVTE